MMRMNLSQRKRTTVRSRTLPKTNIVQSVNNNTRKYNTTVLKNTNFEEDTLSKYINSQSEEKEKEKNVQVQQAYQLEFEHKMKSVMDKYEEQNKSLLETIHSLQYKLENYSLLQRRIKNVLFLLMK
tara:strand:- start:4782 stop:5159 length:378 start_codon:yes stop_codon:yes gene_type:complete